MSKSISSALAAHLAQPVTTMATCWRIILADNSVLRFTDHDAPILTGTEEFLPAASVTPSGIAQGRGTDAATMDAITFALSGTLTKEDIETGALDGATVTVFQVNWADPSMGRLYLCQGWDLMTTHAEGGQIRAEIRSRTERLSRNILGVYSRTCRALLGDARCTVDIQALAQSGSVDSVSNQRVFTVAGIATATGDPTYFNGGIITWDDESSYTPSGTQLNAGLKSEVVIFDDDTGTIYLFAPTPYGISAGDTFTIVPGCDKLLATCKARFDNELNFRGEPFIPQGTSLPLYGSDRRGKRTMGDRSIRR